MAKVLGGRTVSLTLRGAEATSGEKLAQRRKQGGLSHYLRDEGRV